MSKCNFSFELPEDRESLVSKAKEAILGIGGEFEGSETIGTFKLPTPLGTVKGTYTISGPNIALAITDKPMLIGCGKIEEKLREYMKI